MKVFISWSGQRSKAVALHLREWLPTVIQSVEPFMSQHDLGAGTRWGEELDRQLDGTNFGIVCVTPENRTSTWLNYEAGALGKSLATGRVVPYLIGMSDPTELIDSPLTRFQAKIALTQTHDVVRGINAAMSEGKLDDVRLTKTYEQWWPDLEKVLRNLRAPKDVPPKPDTDAVLSEILETVRDLTRVNSSPSPAANESDRVLVTPNVKLSAAQTNALLLSANAALEKNSLEITSLLEMPTTMRLTVRREHEARPIRLPLDSLPLSFDGILKRVIQGARAAYGIDRATPVDTSIVTQKTTSG